MGNQGTPTPPSDTDPTWFLIRAAILGVGNPPAEFHASAELDQVQVTTTRLIRVDERPVGMFAVAAIEVASVPFDEAGAATVPVDARQQCERALELLCRLEALDRRTTHRLSSPTPCVGLWTADGAALQALEGVRLSLPRTPMPFVGVGGVGITESPELLAKLTDRMDGVVMVTEALNATTPLGQFTQFWRLFERAFLEGHARAGQLLAEFLAGSRHGFAPDEISEWTTKRSPAVHADRRNRDFALDAQVQPFVGRMCEAAYDLLFNKEVWASSNIDRRSAWSPKAGSSDRAGSIFGVPGQDWHLQLQLLDHFGAFPALLAGGPDDLVPRGAWLVPEGDDLTWRVLGAWDALGPPLPS